jgi:hypothetical protein
LIVLGLTSVFDQDLARFLVDYLGHRERTLEPVELHADLLDPTLDKLVIESFDDLLALCHDHVLGLRIADLVARLAADQVTAERAEQVLSFPAHRHRLVEGAEDLRIGRETQGPQERRREELPLPVDAHVEDVLLVVLELHPRAAVRDDLREDEGSTRIRFEEDARAAMQLTDDHALGAVDDECSVLGHQRNVAEVDLLLLDVANGLAVGFAVLVPDD